MESIRILYGNHLDLPFGATLESRPFLAHPPAVSACGYQTAVMQNPFQSMPLQLKWLAIALITLSMGLALSTLGPGVDLSKDESLSTTLVLQKKVSDDDGKTLDTADPLEELLAAIIERLAVRHSNPVPVHFSTELAFSAQFFPGSASPRAPPLA